jgi:hypothetical protein
MRGDILETTVTSYSFWGTRFPAGEQSNGEFLHNLSVFDGYLIPGY